MKEEEEIEYKFSHLFNYDEKEELALVVGYLERNDIKNWVYIDYNLDFSVVHTVIDIEGVIENIKNSSKKILLIEKL